MKQLEFEVYIEDVNGNCKLSLVGCPNITVTAKDESTARKKLNKLINDTLKARLGKEVKDGRQNK